MQPVSFDVAHLSSMCPAQHLPQQLLAIYSFLLLSCLLFVVVLQVFCF
jgi:hypothetical protein